MLVSNPSRAAVLFSLGAGEGGKKKKRGGGGSHEGSHLRRFGGDAKVEVLRRRIASGGKRREEEKRGEKAKFTSVPLANFVCGFLARAEVFVT